MEAEGLSLSGDVNPQPFQFHPAIQSPSAWTISRPGQRCHLLFISSTIREEEKVLYIVMLPHLSDISKIEAQAKDQYKLKANTKKKPVKKRSATFPSLEIHSLWCLSASVLCFSRENRDGNRKFESLEFHRYLLRVITHKLRYI